MRKVIPLLLICVFCFGATVTLVSAKAVYENPILADCRVNSLPYDAILLDTNPGEQSILARYYYGTNIIPPVRQLENDSGINVEYYPYTQPLPYDYYGADDNYAIMLYKSARTPRYSIQLNVPPTLAYPRDLLGLPETYSLYLPDEYPEIYVDVHYKDSVTKTDHYIYEKIDVRTDNTYQRYFNVNEYSTMRYEYFFDCGAYLYDIITADVTDDTLLYVRANVKVDTPTYRGGYVGYVTDYKQDIYNTTGTYFDINYADNGGYRPIKRYLLSALGGLHNIMSQEILPDISFYTILATALAIPTTLAVLRRL